MNHSLAVTLAEEEGMAHSLLASSRSLLLLSQATGEQRFSSGE
jgi:hypothetical protein